MPAAFGYTAVQVAEAVTSTSPTCPKKVTRHQGNIKDTKNIGVIECRGKNDSTLAHGIASAYQ